MTLLALLLVVTGAGAAVALDTFPVEVFAQEEPAPPDTEPPDTTQPPEGESDFDPVVLVLVILGVILLLVIIGAISRGSERRSTRQEAAIDDWKVRARGSYGKAKWLSENMTAEMARQLGDVHYKRDALAEELNMEDVAVLDRWHQIERSVQEATSELYALEANPPVSGWSQTVHSTALGLQQVHSRIEEAAKAHVAYRKAEGNPELDTADALEVKLTFERAIRDSEAQLSAGLDQMRQIV
ncbi:MAG: hypothetical protein ACE5MI_12955 [Acidimicrobiia bacterium]